MVEGAAEEFEFALDAKADGGALGVVVAGIFNGGLDLRVRDAASSEVSGDAEFTLAADFRALTNELFGVAGVVEHAVFFEASEDDLGEQFAGGAASEEFFHFVHRVRAAHEGAEGYVVEFGFGVELARLGEHERSIEVVTQ